VVAGSAGFTHPFVVRRESNGLRFLTAMKIVGVVLVVLGIAGLAYGGFSWTRRDTIVDAGPIEITADKTDRFPLPPLAGGLLLVAGVVLILKK